MIVGKESRHRRDLLCALAALVVVAIIVTAAISTVAHRASARTGLDAALRSHALLGERQEALREVALEVTGELSGRVEARRLLVGLSAHEAPCPQPPARDAENDAILACLFEQVAWLEARAHEAAARAGDGIGEQGPALAPRHEESRAGVEAVVSGEAVGEPAALPAAAATR